MSDNKNTLQNITISSDGISSARFTPEGMKKAMEQLIHEHQEFAEQARSGKEQLEAKEARIFELEGRLEAKERLLEEWGVDREKMVNKISELEMNASGLKRDFDDWRADAQEWQDLMIRVCGNDTWTAEDVESHYQMSPKAEQEDWKPAKRQTTSVPRVITREELKDGQWVAVSDEVGGWRAVQVQSNSDEAWLIQDSIGAYPGDTLVLLADAPEPELTTEPGSVILVTEWDGEKLDQPIYAMRGDIAWRNISEYAFPSGSEFTSSFSITGWKNARIVVEDGE